MILMTIMMMLMNMVKYDDDNKDDIPDYVNDVFDDDNGDDVSQMDHIGI